MKTSMQVVMGLLMSIGLQVPFSGVAEAAFVEVPLAQLEVTEGQADLRRLASGLLEIDGARFRATERGFESAAAELVFGYRGEVAAPEPTEGGENRIQIGEKLLSANPCNLIYVMWRLFPTEVLVVSVKRNPGTTSTQCQNRGYTNIVPSILPAGARFASVNVPADLTARSGATRTLRSDFDPINRILSVSVNRRLVWQGRLADMLVHDLEGPAGLRTDNGKFRFRFYTEK